MESKKICPAMIEIPCQHRFGARLVIRDTMVSQSKSIFLYYQDLRDPKLRPLYRLTESSCFLFCLSPGIIINYEKATFEVTFNRKLTTLNLCIIIETIQCPFKVTILN